MPYYRNPRTGLIGEYSDALARRFGYIEVGKDAKPLAYTPIPEEKVAEVVSAPKTASKKEESK